MYQRHPKKKKTHSNTWNITIFCTSKEREWKKKWTNKR